jgi:integrase
LIEQSIIGFPEGKEVSYFNAHIKIVHRIFQYAVEIELLDKNPVKVKRRKGEVIRKRFLNEEERRIFLEGCKKSRSPYLYQMAYISLQSSMRVGEIRKLRREDIRDDCIIHIRRGLQKQKKPSRSLNGGLSRFF